MRVQATIVIKAAPEQVWRFVTVPENGPRWQEGAISTRVTTPGAVGPGTTMEHVGRWLGMRIPTTAVVTVFEPPSHYGYDISSRFSQTPSLMRYSLESLAGGTRLTLSNETAGSLWMRLLGPLLRRSLQGMFERDVARLKSLIEAEEASHRRAPAP